MTEKSAPNSNPDIGKNKTFYDICKNNYEESRRVHAEWFGAFYKMVDSLAKPGEAYMGTVLIQENSPLKNTRLWLEQMYPDMNFRLLGRAFDPCTGKEFETQSYEDGSLAYPFSVFVSKKSS
jgi:hypothetical protein